MQLNSGLGIYWSSVKNAQIGIDPRLTHCFTNLTKAELRLIEALLRPHTLTEIRLFAIENDITKERYQQILRFLAHEKLLEPTQITKIPHHLQPEWRATWRITHSLPERRLHARVEIPHLDWLGTEIALNLAESGIGNLILLDTTPAGTLSHPLLRDNFPQMRKNTALQSYFRAQLPQIRVETKISPARKTAIDARIFPDLAIITTPNSINPLAVNDYLSQGVPVLLACLSEVDLTIGPLCYPGIAPCGLCLHRKQIHENPQWALLAPQARTIRNLPAPFASLKLAASFALRGALEYLDALRYTTNEISCATHESTSMHTREQLLCSPRSLQLFGKAWKIPPNPLFPELLSLPGEPECLCELNFPSSLPRRRHRQPARTLQPTTAAKRVK